MATDLLNFSVTNLQAEVEIYLLADRENYDVCSHNTAASSHQIELENLGGHLKIHGTHLSKDSIIEVQNLDREKLLDFDHSFTGENFLNKSFMIAAGDMIILSH